MGFEGEKNFWNLQEEIGKRRKAEREIRSLIDQYAKNKFGLEGFSARIDEVLGVPQGLNVCLCRQVTTPNIEHAAVNVFAAWLTKLGLPSQASFMSFVRDSFAYDNGFKRSLLKTSLMKRSKRRDGVFAETRKVVTGYKGDLAGRALVDILADDGNRLPDFHQDLVDKHLPWKSHRVDVSSMLEDILRQNLSSRNGVQKPRHFYVMTGEKEKKVGLEFNPNGERIRPSAEWLYLVHLLSFLDGRRVLLSQIGDDKKIADCFSNSIRMIEEAIGVAPIIIDTPYQVTTGNFNSHLHEINVTMAEKKPDDFLPEAGSEISLFSAMEEAEKKLIVNC